MTRRGKIVLAKAAMVIGVLPAFLWAYEYGPNPGYAGVPGESGTCTSCHIGTVNNPANKGSVMVAFPNGLTYTPGVAQQLSVTVTDPATTQKAAGFQLTARLASSTSTMAGTFATVDDNTQVILLGGKSSDLYLSGHQRSDTCSSAKPLQGIPAGRGDAYNTSTRLGLPLTIPLMGRLSPAGMRTQSFMACLTRSQL